MKRKSKHKKYIWIVTATILMAIWIFNNFTIKTVEYSYTTPKAAGEVKIALISDLHSFEYGTDNDMIIKKIQKAKPDLIFVLGDMYSRGQTARIDPTVSFISELAEIADVYAVTGDHDYDDEYKKKLDSAPGVNLLNYDSADIEINGNKLCIYGIDNVYFTATFDLHREFDEPDEEKINILLSHIPSISHYGDFGFDYIFCGDSHGGLIQLPFIGGIYFNGYILPEITYYDTVTDKGPYKFDDTNLYVTSGIGHYPLPIRFNNRPEICFITIKGE